MSYCTYSTYGKVCMHGLVGIGPRESSRVEVPPPKKSRRRWRERRGRHHLSSRSRESISRTLFPMRRSTRLQIQEAVEASLKTDETGEEQPSTTSAAVDDSSEHSRQIDQNGTSDNTRKDASAESKGSMVKENVKSMKKRKIESDEDENVRTALSSDDEGRNEDRKKPSTNVVKKEQNSIPKKKVPRKTNDSKTNNNVPSLLSQFTTKPVTTTAQSQSKSKSARASPIPSRPPPQSLPSSTTNAPPSSSTNYPHGPSNKAGGGASAPRGKPRPRTGGQTSASSRSPPPWQQQQQQQNPPAGPSSNNSGNNNGVQAQQVQSGMAATRFPSQQVPTAARPLRPQDRILMKRLEDVCSRYSQDSTFQLAPRNSVDLFGSFLVDSSDTMERRLDFFDTNSEGEIVLSPKIPIFPEEFPPGMTGHSFAWWGIADQKQGIGKFGSVNNNYNKMVNPPPSHTEADGSRRVGPRSDSSAYQGHGRHGAPGPHHRTAHDLPSQQHRRDGGDDSNEHRNAYNSRPRDEQRGSRQRDIPGPYSSRSNPDGDRRRFHHGEPLPHGERAFDGPPRGGEPDSRMNHYRGGAYGRNYNAGGPEGGRYRDGGGPPPGQRQQQRHSPPRGGAGSSRHHGRR